jgi:hypothetical protein
MTNQWYQQQLQNEVVEVIQVAGHDVTFFQQDGACSHTVNVILDVLRDVFGSPALFSQFQELFRCGWS